MTKRDERTSGTDLAHEGVEILAAFAVALRAAGVPVTTDRTTAFLQAAAIADAGDGAGVYWAGRATLCGCLDDLERYDQVYAAWFADRPVGTGARQHTMVARSQAPLGREAEGEDDSGKGISIHASASSAEVLRHRDIAELTAAERASLAALFATLRPRPPTRSSARRRPSRRGEIDARRTLRAELRNAGEPGRLRHRARSVKPRRVVLLVDVSGSMSPYADSLLRFAHVVTAMNRSRTEVFTVGTRLTRVTRAMRLRDPDAALAAAGTVVPDWSGGTRLGETLQVFLDRWGQRGLARGAVVVVMSDGWERGDADLLGEQMQRLQRLSHRVIWANPHRGRPGYVPIQVGIVAALPHVDELVAGHSMAAFEQVLEAVSDA